MAVNDEAIVRYQKALCVCGYHVYKETREAATGKTLVCVVWSQGTLGTEMSWLLKRMGKLSAFCHEKCSGCALFFEERWKRSLHCDYYGSSTFHQANCSICLNVHGFNFHDSNPTKISVTIVLLVLTPITCTTYM